MEGESSFMPRSREANMAIRARKSDSEIGVGPKRARS